MAATDTPSRRRPVAVVIGFMGAGKSTVGRILAERLGVDFLDTDTEIQRRTGRSIPEIFGTDGADRFREMEADVVLDVLDSHGGVVALGGGAVMTPAVAQGLSGQRVVYLHVDADEGFARVDGSDRPLLAGADARQRYRDLLAEREDTYRRISTITVDAAVGDADRVADAVLAQIARRPVSGRTAHR